MPSKTSPGLGELLRHLVELTDGKTDSWYRAQGMKYRPRYTPIMRALANGPATVSDIQEQLSVTQGAVSQTLKLMVKDSLIKKKKGEDARQAVFSLTEHGQELLEELTPHWDATFDAIRMLEKEIQIPLMECLKRSVVALGQRSFAERIRDSKTQASADSSRSVHKKNPFQSGGDRYSEFRPSYPSELAESLAKLGPGNRLAIDVGCGNGQLTSLLAPNFDKVVGIDSSKDQLKHAERAENVTYQASAAEDTGLPDDSVDLITVAQAAHWFDLEKFYDESQRVAKHEAVIALVSYGVPYISDTVNTIFQKGYWQEIHEFWPPQRAHVETGYAHLHFPFPLVQVSSHNCQAEMNVEQFIDYITTWSAYAKACSCAQQDRFSYFFEALRNAWSGDAIKEIVWPISIKAGRIQKTGE